MGTSAASSRGKKLLILGGLFFAVWVVALLYVFVSAPPAATRAPAKIQTLEVLYDIPEASPEALAGISENVFVGKVERRSGQDLVTNTGGRPGEEGKPLTEFAVSVVEEIKADGPEPALEGRILTIGQYGGERDGKTYRVVGIVGSQERSDAPLEPGGEYLFSTSYSSLRNLQEISVQPHGNVPLRGAELEAREDLIGAFRGAVEAR